jgi:hypothetical protein
MWGRVLIIWFGLLVLAIVNGAAREALLLTVLGDRAAHAASSVMLSTAVLVVTWASIDWIAPRSLGQAWAIGVMWLVLTVSFEFLAGHYLFHAPWEVLLADYRILEGRLWIAVLIVTLLAPPFFGSFSLFSRVPDNLTPAAQTHQRTL